MVAEEFDHTGARFSPEQLKALRASNLLRLKMSAHGLSLEGRSVQILSYDKTGGVRHSLQKGEQTLNARQLQIYAFNAAKRELLMLDPIFNKWATKQGLPVRFAVGNQKIWGRLYYIKNDAEGGGRVAFLHALPEDMPELSEDLFELCEQSTGRLANSLKKVEILEKSATTDALTGVLNRKGYMAEFARMTSRDTRVLYEAKKRDQGAKRPEHGFIMVDLDHFKAVNDTYGHAAGDEVLKESVLRISKLMRDTDLIARRGGEEFLITLAECPIKNAIKLAEEMRKSIEEKPFSIVDQNGNKRKITVHASFGVTSASTPAMRNRNGLFAQFVESIISAADKALYIAKGDPKHKNTHPQVKEKIETGRNRTKFRRFYPQISQP